MINDKLINPNEILAEKGKGIEKLDRVVDKLQSEMEELKKCRVSLI